MPKQRDNQLSEATATVSGDEMTRSLLNKIAGIPPLTGIQEIELAILIESGLEAAEELLKMDACVKREIDPAVQHKLLRAQQTGLEAQRQLVEAHLPLVAEITPFYAGRDMPLIDLIETGKLGLIRAVPIWDYTKGFKFSTYSAFWVRVAIVFELARRRYDARIPMESKRMADEIIRTYWRLYRYWADDPTPEEIADAMRAPAEPVAELFEIIEGTGVLQPVRHTPAIHFEGYAVAEDE